MPWGRWGGSRRASPPAGRPPASAASSATGTVRPRRSTTSASPWEVLAQQRRRGALGVEHAAVDGDQRGLLLAGEALVGADGRLHRRCWGLVSCRGPVPGGGQV